LQNILGVHNKLTKEIKDKYGIYVIQRMKGILVGYLITILRKEAVAPGTYLFIFLIEVGL